MDFFSLWIPPLELCGITKGRNSNVFFETPSVTNRKKIIPKFFCISGTKKQTKKQPKQIECWSVLFGSNRKWVFEASLIMRKHTVNEWDCIVGLRKILALNSCVLQLFGNFICLIWNKLLYRKIVFLLKGTQAWEIFWLRFWILYYFIVN